MGYGCLLDFTVFGQLIRHVRLISGFCPSGYDFAIPSSRLHLTIQTLGVAMGFVGNYAPCGLPPQTGGMPVIPKNCRLRDSFAMYISFLFKKRIILFMILSDVKLIPERSLYERRILVYFGLMHRKPVIFPLVHPCHVLRPLEIGCGIAGIVRQDSS